MNCSVILKVAANNPAATIPAVSLFVSSRTEQAEQRHGPERSREGHETEGKEMNAEDLGDRRRHPEVKRVVDERHVVQGGGDVWLAAAEDPANLVE
jgi:hypothetical protein